MKLNQELVFGIYRRILELSDDRERRDNEMSVDTKIINQIIRRDYNLVRDVEVLLHVNFPILFTFVSDVDKTYIAYVVKYKKRSGNLELICLETDNQTIYGLVSQRISIKNAFNKNDVRYLSTTEVTRAEIELSAILPSDDFYLTELLPNTVDITQKRKKILNKLLFNRE
jgi:hypothetical protein